ncbi:anti-anti-sigma factor [Actinoplanes solisilvae]|uniref:anti-anti-sigma factor n=1 Tax=Actinoplanes solisilvae TaxID=2486853 RepID=UPI00196B751C|nr:anti-anti-sigma factor [Actinoplanes solisilvae]
MASEVRHRVDRGSEYPLVQLAGVLDTDTAGAVRAALLEVLADQPEAMLVDVGQLSLATAGDVAVLRDLRLETTDWPAAHLVLCDARGATAWPDAGWPVWPGVPEALAELGRPDPDHRFSLALEPAVGAARRSRELITEACARWERAEVAGPACIVVTELVNNVVVHARTPMVVLVAAHGSGISVAVRDQSRHQPTFTGSPVPPTAYGGRGMLLIDSVASRWGNLPLDDGKVVWALLSGEAQEADAQDAGAQEAETVAFNAPAASMTDPARG